MRLLLTIRTSAAQSEGAACDPGEYEIGRNPDCAINFGDTPVEGVSWRHARLAFADGQWSLSDLGSTNGTYVNGRRLDQPVVLQPGDEVRLGQKGPRIAVCQIGDRAADASASGVPTAPAPGDSAEAAVPDGGTVVGATRLLLLNLQDRLGHMQGRNRRLAVAAAGLGVVGAAAVAVALWSQHASLLGAVSEGDARHTQEQQALKRQVEEEAAQRQAKEKDLERQAAEARALAEKTGQMVAELENNKAAIVRKNSDAVYFVFGKVGDRSFSGTAFAVAAGGTFGTNAHIAEPVRALLAAGGKAVLVAQGGARVYPIKRAVPHSGYTGNPRGPDVGLLFAELPPGESLGTVVQLAGRDDLRELGPGAPLLYIGFPVFDAADYASLKKVDARVFAGTLNRLMTFAEERGEFASQYWLEHDIISWHGASGSPVFNHRGKVVALINSGFSVNGAQAAANPNKGAVRVDLLQELLAANR